MKCLYQVQHVSFLVCQQTAQDVRLISEDMVFATSVLRVVMVLSPAVLITVLTLFVVTGTQKLIEDTSKVVEITSVVFRKNFRACGTHGLNCGFVMFVPGQDGTSGIAHYGTSWPGYGKHRNENRTNCDWDFFDDGYVNRKYGIGFGNTFGSNCQRVNIDYYGYTPCYGQTVYRAWGGRGECAPWYGGDGGHHGLPPMAGSVCNNSTGNWCMTRQYVPYPGGWVNDRGGYYIVRNHTNGCMSEFTCHMQHVFGVMSNWTDDNQVPIPGMGGWSAASYGGPCYCGQAGGPGAVIITYHT